MRRRDFITLFSGTAEFDVVVLGGGGTGLAAAIEAAALGRKVVLIEKDSKLGGTTARSVGSISASNTPHQLRNGILDSSQDHFEDLREFNAPLGVPNNDVLQRILVENVPETFRWLMSMGIEFFGPMKELPHRKPRMHNILPSSRAYAYHLGRRARALGVDVRTSTRARRFIVDSGRVVGVVCDGPNGPIEFRARGGVLTCTGDYAGSAEKRAKYIAPEMAKVEPVNPVNTGDGHDMVLELGGRIVNPQLHLAGIRFQAPPAKWIASLPPYRWLTKIMRIALERFGGSLLRPLVMSFLVTVLVPSPKMFQRGAILVNRRGERFCDELNNPGPKVAAQPDQFAYILLDGSLAETFTGWPNYVSTAPGFAYASINDYRQNRKDIFHEADSVTALAQKLGMGAAGLQKTIDDYNRAPGAGRSPLTRGPYIALGPVRYFINFTDGGLAVNEKFEVLGKDDRPIPGLYAAGSTGMGGALLEGHGHHLGWAFTSGRLAARRAAQNVVSADIPEAAGAVPAAH
jgi:succinate dehydrogenase/fumarate reductase flavoprotein subunit